jgi:hypothetical protein
MLSLSLALASVAVAGSVELCVCNVVCCSCSDAFNGDTEDGSEQSATMTVTGTQVQLRDVVDGLPIGTPTRAYVICELPLL